MFWLVAIYPLSYGPLIYCYERGWLSDSFVENVGVAYIPIEAITSSVPELSGPFESQLIWWTDLAHRHSDHRSRLFKESSVAPR